MVLGIVQGLTEFLPISSTGHLRIIPSLVGWEDPGAYFTAVIQIGTVLAVVIYFWRDLLSITTTWLRSLRRPELRGELDARMGWYVIIATIPISVFLIGSALIVLGLILGAADRYGKRVRDYTSVRLPDAVAVGLAQALALIPGVSRSGSTITMGLFLGMKRDVAARFSFLLSVPAIVLSGGYGLLEIFTSDEETVGIGPILIATVFAFISGYAAIAFLLRWLANHSTGIFVVYRIALGVLVIGLAAAGAID
jgi:undecaprenyl-diphosphatase